MSTLTFVGNSQTRKRNSGYDLWIEAGNHGTEQDYELALHGISVAQVALYKRASSTPNRYDTDGGSAVTYTFENGSIVFANPDPLDPDIDANSGWHNKMYAGSDDIYVVYASANANGATDIIPASQFSPPALLSMAGAQGDPGKNVCVVPIYKASSTTPYPSSMPTRDDVQFNFSTGAITNLDNGWYKNPPVGDKIWCSTAIASSTGNSATILHGSWSEPTVWKEKGEKGDDGNDGDDGADANVIDLILSSQTYAENLRLSGTTKINATISLQGVYSSGNLSVFFGNTSLSFITKVNSTVKNPPVSSVSVRDGDIVTISIPNTYTNSVTIQLASVTPAGSVSKICNPVDETEYGHDFGVVTSLPSSFYDSSGMLCSLLDGDFFMANAVFSYGSGSTVIGFPYILKGTWDILTASDASDAEKLLSCLNNAVASGLNPPSDSPLYKWCVNFIAQTAVINSLFTRALTLLSGGSFQSAELVYDQSDQRFVKNGFILESNGNVKLGSAYLRDIKIKCTDSQSVILLETQEYQPSSTSIPCSSKTTWKQNDLYNSVQSTNSYGRYNSGTRRYITPVTDFYSWYDGSTSTQVADGAQFTIPLSGWYKLTSKYQSTDTSYSPPSSSVSYVTSSSGTIISGSVYDTISRSQLYPGGSVTVGRTVYLEANTVLTMHANYIRSTITISLEDGSVSMTDASWTTDSSSLDGTLIQHKGLYKQFRRGCYYSGRLVVENGFDSNNYINYASVNGWYNNITSGIEIDLDSTSITIDGTSYSVKSVSKSIDNITFIDSNGNPHVLYGPSVSNEGGSTGWYNISGTLYPVGKKSSLNTHNLNATQNDSDIGADKPYRNVKALKFIGNVNGQGTADTHSYKVWGAVFN